MGGVEAAGAEETDSHGDTGTDESGEDLAISLDGVSTVADSVGRIASGLAEVIDLIRRLEESQTIDDSCGGFERSDESAIILLGVKTS